MRGRSIALHRLILARRRVADHLAQHHDLRTDFALRFEQHRIHVHRRRRTRQARACSACARPISPPSAVTAALFDMFCGLNGRTVSPGCTSARLGQPRSAICRHRSRCPETSARAPACFLKLDAGLRLHAGGKVMFHQRHLGDEIGGDRNHFRFGIAAGHDDMEPFTARRQRGDNDAQIDAKEAFPR